MTTEGRRWRVAIVGGAGTLSRAAQGLRRHGVEVERHEAFRVEPAAPERVRDAIARFGPYDLLLLTSKESVRALARAGALPRRRAGRRTTRVAAGGPATARALARAGVPARWTFEQGLGRAVAEQIPSDRPLRIVYARSNRAGGGVARSLRGRGHDVLDLVVYRVALMPRTTRAVGGRLARADRIVVTSPSALSFLRRSLPAGDLRDVRRRRSLVVLGSKSAHAARGHGFRGVKVLPSLEVRSVNEFLLEELRNAR